MAAARFRARKRAERKQAWAPEGKVAAALSTTAYRRSATYRPSHGESWSLVPSTSRAGAPKCDLYIDDTCCKIASNGLWICNANPDGGACTVGIDCPPRFEDRVKEVIESGAPRRLAVGRGGGVGQPISAWSSAQATTERRTPPVSAWAAKARARNAGAQNVSFARTSVGARRSAPFAGRYAWGGEFSVPTPATAGEGITAQADAFAISSAAAEVANELGRRPVPAWVAQRLRHASRDLAQVHDFILRGGAVPAVYRPARRRRSWIARLLGRR